MRMKNTKNETHDYTEFTLMVREMIHSTKLTCIRDK